LLAAGVYAGDVRMIEQIVAKVNGDIITLSEMERTRQTLRAELQQQRVPPAEMERILRERERNALRDQIDQLLLVQKGKELGINVDPEVTRQLAEIQLQAKITDTDKFHQYVREQSGLPFEDFKQQMKNSLLTRRVVQQEVGGRISISKAEMEKYYEEHKNEFIREEQVFLREIFLSTEGKTPAQINLIERKAKDLVARARKGEKFADLARDHSDSESAKNGGEIGWFKRGELRDDVEKLVFAERRNFVSDPIKTDRGFLIVRLEERHEAGQASLQEVENEVMERLYMPRMEPRVREYLTKLRQEAFLEIREGFVDSGAAPGKDTSWRDPAQLRPETTTKAEVAARRKRKLLWVVPLPGGKGRPAAEAATPDAASTQAAKP
jgi:parvulin-like peptidyl-prolyl isomerase